MATKSAPLALSNITSKSVRELTSMRPSTSSFEGREVIRVRIYDRDIQASLPEPSQVVRDIDPVHAGPVVSSDPKRRMRGRGGVRPAATEQTGGQEKPANRPRPRSLLRI